MLEPILNIGEVWLAHSARYDSGIQDFEPYLRRHAAGDWGDVDAKQLARNEEIRRVDSACLGAISIYSLPDGSSLKLLTAAEGITHIQWLEADPAPTAQ